ncbi:hypothetical protein [Actibacterium pelagium]|uniref:Flp pilus assembly protein, pilin Flp n=1 Tax=Actibacterium pelagium TaxID=2029103 RepID=A0A917AFL0_9RHOB|nr:hypothetical protein [Actibacterium pelagium]GGE49516.1 hypothetical protein GCM10011517_16670 [Actibacterium pelagium]
MNAVFQAFVEDEGGAVTVDWVVLTAAIVGLAIFVIFLVRGGAGALATKISNTLANSITVGTTGG